MPSSLIKPDVIPAGWHLLDKASPRTGDKFWNGLMWCELGDFFLCPWPYGVYPFVIRKNVNQVTIE